MYLNKNSSDRRKRLILIPLSHDRRESQLDRVLPDLFRSHRYLNIYWEDINRGIHESSKEIGLEDAKLLALFELTIFMVAYEDPRLHDVIYEGMGTKLENATLSKVDISRKASLVARGVQAVVNLNTYFGAITADRKDSDILRMLGKFDIDELVEQRNNDRFLDEYINKLQDLYEVLINSLKQDREYSFVNFDFILNAISKINRGVSFFDSRYLGTNLKEYIENCEIFLVLCI